MTRPTMPLVDALQEQGVTGVSADADRATHEPNPQAVSALRVGIADAAVPILADWLAVEVDEERARQIVMQSAAAFEEFSRSPLIKLGKAWGEFPEAVCHGIIRLSAHRYCDPSTWRDPFLPAAVAALWRPWRRLYPASAIEARSGQTEGLDPKGESAAPEGGDAQ